MALRCATEMQKIGELLLQKLLTKVNLLLTRRTLRHFVQIKYYSELMKNYEFSAEILCGLIRC